MQTKKNLLNLLVKYIYILPGCLQHCCFSFALAPWSIVCQIMRYKDRRQTRVWRTTELQPQRPRLHSNLPYEPSSAGQRMTHIRRTPPGLSVVIQDYLIHSVAHLQTPPLSPDKVEQNKILEERVGKERKEREQLTQQKASERSLWLLCGTTLRIMFLFCIVLNPLFFLYFFEKVLHFRLVALVSQSVF